MMTSSKPNSVNLAENDCCPNELQEFCRNGRIPLLIGENSEKAIGIATANGDENNNRQRPAKMWKAEGIQIKTTLSPQLQLAAQNLSMVYLTLCQTLNPLMVRGAHKIANQTGRQFLSSTIVLNTEVTKLAMSCLILIFTNGLKKFTVDLSCAFFKNKRETLKVCVPALIYVVQNNLYFFALKRVEATLFSISYQLRILTTAVLSMLLLRRVFTRLQWGALCISLAGVCLVQLGSGGNEDRKKEGKGGEQGRESAEQQEQQFLGLITVFVMCWTSAFAGVYLEGVLKQSGCDIWMQNIRLSVITLPFALLTIANDAEQIQKDGLLSGWNWLLWTIVFSSSSSGLVVAAVMKYADNIKKSYCQSVALGGTALLSILMGDSQFSWALLAGVSLVIASVFLYTLNPPKKSPSMPKAISSSASLSAGQNGIDADDEEGFGLLEELEGEENGSSEEGKNGGKMLVELRLKANEGDGQGKCANADGNAQRIEK